MKALVTGASQGIGLAIAQSLAKEGHQVCLAARNESRLLQAVEKIQAEGGDACFKVLDVSEPEAVKLFFSNLEKDWAGLDILIHSAGSHGFSDIEKPDDPELWQHVIQTNLSGSYYCAREALLLMKKRGQGRIVFISSTLGLRGMRNAYAYSASKHGVLGLMKSLAHDVLEYGITVNAVCPGWVDTPMGHQSMTDIAAHHRIPADDFISAEIQAVPLGRWIHPAEVADLVHFLSSEKSAAITGQAFEISGGLS